MTRLSACGSFAALLLLAPNYAVAQDYTAGDIVIQSPWARATPKGAKVAGAYLTIVNHGKTADTLTGGSLSVAGQFAVHDMTVNNGVMRMRDLGTLEIPPGGTVTLAPSGRHIMITDLHRGLQKGETIDGSLTFAHAGTVPVQFTVEGIGAKTPGDEASHSMPGMKM